MKLVVRVIEARNLPSMDLNGSSDPYVRLQLGRNRFRTKVVKKSLNPLWHEEFTFWVEDLSEDLVVSVLDEDRYFNDDFVGQLKLPVSQVFDAEDKSLGTTWHKLHPKNKKSRTRDCGEIRLNVFFSQNSAFMPSNSDDDLVPPLRKQQDFTVESPPRYFSESSRSSSPMPSGMRMEDSSSREEKVNTQKTIAGRIAQIFIKNGDLASCTSARSIDSSELSDTSIAEVNENKPEEQSSSCNFEEAMKRMEAKDQGNECPSNLPGGVLLDQLYGVASSELNSLLFAPDSLFPGALADLQGTTELQQGPWVFENGGDSLKRVVTYIKAATRLIKAVKATEDQTYLKADGKVFSVLASVSTPDVMYGSTFKTEVLYCITPGPEMPSGEQSSQLIISWRMNFVQNTMMKSMIENGARQGLKDSYGQYGSLLAQNVKPINPKDLGSNKEQVLASLQVERQSDWKLAFQYFANITMVSTIIAVLYVSTHIWIAVGNPIQIQGLEFVGLDLPDSIGEVIVCAFLVIQAERVLKMIARFMKARAQKGSDHGVKAQGDGWLVTVALIEGSSLAAVDSSAFSDPYVVFTTNGRTRTSSIKFQKANPLWNEIFEFDAMDEPPSVLEVEVLDFDGPFDEATSLGHAEINFVKTNLADLADVWIPLHGKLAQACQSKLHLRIFLNNTRGNNVVREYLTKMEKEVGKKINLRSPQTNSAFQKLFGLPPEEFLINDFTCHLKRKMPTQGRLFLSARIIGFHANLFGHKTKFFFLWEDIDDIQLETPTLSSMGSPVIVMTLRPGRGMDARHGAKSQDAQGRLKFHFHSFVSFNVAQRTIMALWKARSLSLEQKVRMVEESESKSLQTEEGGSFLGLEDVYMPEVYSAVPSLPANFCMELFNGGELEYKIMQKIGCLNYSTTPWELDKGDVYVRQICFKFDKNISCYRGEAVSTQQRSLLPDKNGWVIEEVLALHGIPLGDYFNLHLRYQIERAPLKDKGCAINVFFGIAWLKSTRLQKRTSKNIQKNLQVRLKQMIDEIEKEFLAAK